MTFFKASDGKLRLLTALALVAVCLLMLACQGGGSSGGTGVGGAATGGTIYGKIVAPPELRLNMLRPSGNGSPVPRALVWLESDRNKTALTDDEGNFTLTNVPYSQALRVVCRYDTAASAELFLLRTAPLTLNPGQPVKQLDELLLQKGVNSISGVLRDQLGQPISNASLQLWGIQFKSDSEGNFTSPPLPATAGDEKLLVQAAGYRDMEIELPFAGSDNNPQRFEITLSDTSEPNFAPVPYFFQVPSQTAPSERIQLSLKIVDPDEMLSTQFRPEWQASAGTISQTADPLSIYWTAPDSAGMATISAVVEDSRGAKGRAELGIAVGGIKTVVMRVEAVEPLAGAYGTPVLIKGSGFGNDSEKMQISFNGKAAVVKSCTDNQIQTEVPSGATTGILLLVNENGEKSAGIFTVLDSDLAISPDYGPPGTVLTISGSDFSAKQGENGVAVNGIDAEVLAWSESQIQVHVPDKAISGVVSVMIGEKNRNAGLFRVTRVFSISEVKTRMGATLTITGEGFGNSQADSTLQFAGPAAAQIDLWSDEKLVIRVPAAAETGVLQAKLQNQTFTVAELAVNSITGLSAGSAVAGAEIELSGTGFQAEQNQSQVRIGETVAEILSWSDRLIKIRVPAGTRPGNVVVDLNGHLSNARHLNIMAITSISHSRRPVGAKLTIEGYGFGSNTGYVLFGNESVGNFSLWSTNKIEVTVPETVEGLVAIKVSSQGVRSAAKDFYAVTVSGIDEYEGWVGREITITGNSFGLQTEADKVLFNDLVAEVVSWSDSEIKVRVPVEAQSGPMFLTIGGWPVTLEENFVIYDQYEYTQLYPEWSGPRANSRPLLPDLATDADGNTFITDFDNGWVWKIAADGTQSKFGNFNMPWGIAISPLSNEIYIVDSGNHSLQVYDGDGNFLRSIGVLGNGDLQFRSPRGIAFDGAGRIYIADALNDRIQILAADESFLAELGIYGNNDGEFSSPSGVAIDENLVLYVADTSNDRIQRFVPDNAVTPANWNFAGWLGSKDPNALTPGWLTGGSSLTSNKEGGFNRPFGVAVSETGKLLVADSNNNRIQVLAADNAQFANFIGVAGITSGQYNQPLAVEVVSGNAAIADSGNARLQYSTFAGAFIAQITPNTSLLNTEPFRVAVDSANQRVYVLDREDSSITVFNLAGEVMQIIGSKGAGREQFYLPEGIAIDGSGNVYVADTGNARIHKISSAGQFIEFWGIYGTGAGQFYQPNAIAVSANGAQIFVTDSQLHRVQRFDGQGNYLNGWGSFGSGDAGFNNPAGIAVDESGNVYIADKNNHRIKKYSVNGGLLGWWGAYDPGAQAFWLDPGSNRSGALSDADGAFDTPTDVAVDNEGRVLVTDSNNFRIQLFAAQQSEGIAAGFQTEIYIGENLQALTVDDWARVYCIDAQKKVLRFAPDL